MGIATHLIFRACDSRVLAPSIVARRALARAFVEAGARHRLFVFGAADTHVHAVVLHPPGRDGVAAHALALALRGAVGLEVPLQRTARFPVTDQRHLAHVFTYVLNQARHHGVDTDPWLEATALPELLGLRPGGDAIRATVGEHLPRLGPLQLTALYGRRDLEPVLAVDHLVEATAAAAAADLRTRDPRVLLARRAALYWALPALGPRRAAATLGVPPRTVRWSAARPADPGWVRAVGLQMALRAGTRPPGLSRG